MSTCLNTSSLIKMPLNMSKDRVTIQIASKVKDIRVKSLSAFLAAFVLIFILNFLSMVLRKICTVMIFKMVNVITGITVSKKKDSMVKTRANLVFPNSLSPHAYKSFLLLYLISMDIYAGIEPQIGSM
jgi:hypothetical protein